MSYINMHNVIAVHEADSVIVNPVERCKSCSNDLGYFYSQRVDVKEEGRLMPTAFTVYFNDAVNKRMENERLAAERHEAQDQANALEYLERKAEQNMLDL